jgi:hypothetical protein
MCWPVTLSMCRRCAKTLDSRYDDITSGKVEMLDGEEAFAMLRAKSDAWLKSRT